MTAQPWRFGANFQTASLVRRGRSILLSQGFGLGREQGILDGGVSGDLPRVEMAEYEPHVMRAGGGGKLGVRLSADRFRLIDYA